MDQPARAGLPLDGLPGNGVKRVVGELQLDVLHVEQLGVLLDQRVLRLDQDLDQGGFVEVLQRRDHRQTADELRDSGRTSSRSSGSQFLSTSPVLRSSGQAHARRSRSTSLQAVGDDLLEAREGAAADEQDVGRVDLEEFLLRMLAAALRRNRGGRAFHQLEQRLLHALARDVAGDRRLSDLRLILSISSM